MSLITINNIKTYFEVYGSGTPILFIHGLGSGTEGWKYQVEFFSKKHKVYLYDVRGHGKSDKPSEGYSVEQFALDCYSFIKEVIGEPTHIVGISMGGIIAFQLAVDFPEQILSLTIVNSIPEFRIKGFKLKTKFWMRVLLTWLFGMKFIGTALSHQLLIGDEFSELRMEFINEWSRNNKKTYLKSLFAMLGWSVANKLANMNVPVLMIASEFDYSSIQTKEYYTNILPQAQLAVIKNSRHALPVEKPSEFNQKVLDFINNLN